MASPLLHLWRSHENAHDSDSPRFGSRFIFLRLRHRSASKARAHFKSADDDLSPYAAAHDLGRRRNGFLLRSQVQRAKNRQRRNL